EGREEGREEALRSLLIETLTEEFKLNKSELDRIKKAIMEINNLETLKNLVKAVMKRSISLNEFKKMLKNFDHAENK
ncbi:MAG: hypothetical protein ACTSVC_12085, partial [Promethearchaeota archaeon]